MISVSRQSGFSLIEIMVSVVLLSTSVIGLAALQSMSTRYDNQAYMRSQSVMLVREMIDRMRSNQEGVDDGHYETSPIPSTYTKNCGNVAVTCTAQELAIYDLVVWNQRASGLLPGGFGSVSLSGSNRNIKISWIEQVDKTTVGDGYVNVCDGSSNEQLHCFQVWLRI